MKKLNCPDLLFLDIWEITKKKKIHRSVNFGKNIDLFAKMFMFTKSFDVETFASIHITRVAKRFHIICKIGKILFSVAEPLIHH